MAKITKTEITDIDGRVIKVRTIEGDIIEVEWPDGNREVIRDHPVPPRAEEWPYRSADSLVEWQLFNFPADTVLRMLREGLPVAVRLFSENGEMLLKLVGIALGAQFSADRQTVLMGTEAPLDSSGRPQERSTAQTPAESQARPYPHAGKRGLRREPRDPVADRVRERSPLRNSAS